MAHVHYTLMVCEPCIVTIANGEYVECGPSGYEDIAPRIVALWEDRLGEDARYLVCACDEDNDPDACDTFSTRACDACGDELAGARHGAAVVS